VVSSLSSFVEFGLPIDDPVILDLPERLLTERLVMQVPEPGDGGQLYLVAAASAPELRLFLDWAEAGVFASQIEAFCRRQRAFFLLRQQINFILRRRADGQVLGVAGMVACDWSLRQFEIGYWLGTQYTGNGYMTEACAELIRFAKRDLNATKITIRCDAANHKSASVAKRLGLIKEATIPRERRRAGGSWITLERYGLVTCSDT
jgi:RimJ/RimL family protein N-acetyltransferase